MKSKIVEAVGRAERPLTLHELQNHVPMARRSDLDELVDRGVLHPCSRGRYWHRDEMDHLVSLARSEVEAEPKTRRALSDWLSAHDPFLPRSVRHAVYDRLRELPGVWEWPGGAGHRSTRLATCPPDPGAYLARVREQYERWRDRLTEAGLDEQTVAQAVTGSTESRDPGASEAPRNVLHELAFAWNDAPDATARASLERVLLNIGAERLGQVDEAVTFDGRLHRTDDDLFPDEPAAVLEPGWVHGTAQQRVVLVKARVRAAP